MRILVVSQMFWPEDFRINDLAVELVRRGHEVTVLTGLPNYPEGRIFTEFRCDPRGFDELHGVRIVRVPIVSRGQSRLRLLLNYLSFVVSGTLIGAWRLRGRRFDAILVHESSPVTVGLPAAALRSLKKAPLAFWVLDLWPDTLEALGVVRGKTLLGVVGRLVAFIYRRCDLIMAQSRSFIPKIAKYCTDLERIVYFPSWAEPIFGVEEVEPAAEVPEKAGSFDVMFAGNIGEAQDFPSILSAAERLKGNSRIRWLIVGDGRMAGWVRQEIRRRGLQESVLMLGRYPVERMPSFYMHANVLLVALKDEPIFAMTIPGKLQSYLAAGIPVVAMLNGEGADVVERAACGIGCRAGDPVGLAAAVQRLASLPGEQLVEMGRNAAAISAREFDRDALISRLELWLTRLSAGERGRMVTCG
ncbi:MAG: glycosyltransferase family 4 protein [Gammaproteobacteria bacterium]|nr:glycosyltransferase family 4 protein [Gammaproteobacteria bacterium]